VSHKFWEDDCYENKQIAEIVGIDVKELNSLERNFMKGIDWRLYNQQTPITDKDLEQISEQITRLDYKVIIAEGKKKHAKAEKKKAEIAAMAKRIVVEIIDTVVGNIMESDSKKMLNHIPVKPKTSMQNETPKPHRQSKCKNKNKTCLIV
jgi:hypothetical protein